MARMTTMTTAVIAVPGVGTVFHGVAFVLGMRVVNMAGLGGRDAVVVMVMVMRGRVRHCSSLPFVLPRSFLRSGRVSPRTLQGPSGRLRRPAQEAGLISLSTTHLWFVMVIPSDS
ncbi:hypothetical protein GCM10009585_12630 [Brevibacterium paucivorans]